MNTFLDEHVLCCYAIALDEPTPWEDWLLLFVFSGINRILLVGAGYTPLIISHERERTMQRRGEIPSCIP